MATINNFPLIHCNDLVLGYDRPLGRPFSFTLKKNSMTAILGANGSGKSTLLKALIGEPCYLSGKVEVIEGTKFVRLSARQKGEFFSYVGQEHQFVADMKVGDFLKFAFLMRVGLFRKLPVLTREQEGVLVKMNIDPNSSLRQLSTGERQRVFLARAILQSPELLVLDEPTNHLDPSGVSEFWEALLQTEKKGAVILSTHDVSFVREHCEETMIMRQGTLEYHGPTREAWKSDAMKTVYGDKWFQKNREWLSKPPSMSS